MSSTDDLATIAGEIESIAERLADRSLDLLHAALREDGDRATATTERVVTRARSALEKAASLLRGLDGD